MNSMYEIDSQHGHDAFDGIRTIRQLEVVFKKKQMKIVKFGGKSWLMGRNQYRLDIIERKIKQEEKIAIVISARGNATDELDDILLKTELQTLSKF
jgi:hypothetical protein